MMITMLSVAWGVLALELPRAVYPPSPRVDAQRMVLRIDIPDMASPRATAVQDLTVQAPLFGTSVDELVLDAKGLAIDSMASPGRLVGFAIDQQKIGRNLTVTLDPPLAPGERAKITTSYTIVDPPQGLVWTLPDPAYPGRPPQIHTQGQAELNSYWFPVLDFPNDRLQTELIATVPEGFEVISNGKLVDRSKRGNRVEFHWRQEKPHVPYLVSMIVGQFDTIDVAPNRARVPLPVFVPPGRAADVQRTFGRTSEMVTLFERLFDEPYPWEKYAQTLAWNFEAGGMENTSATTLYESAVLSPEGAADDDLEGLIAHELAHQWFGDLITCRTWEHIWLNEGFATYCEKLWVERREPRKLRAPGRPLRSTTDPETGPDAALAMTVAWLDQLAGDTTDPAQPAMATKHYEDPDDVFALAANPYPKGALVLHALREKLGDDVFFRGLTEYVDRFKLQEVETTDFRRVMEEVSGETLEGFFRQSVHRPGLPRLKAQIDWDAQRSELVLQIEQTQAISGDVPAFAFDLPVSVLDATGTWRALTPIAVSARSTRAAFPMSAEPRGVAVNPRNSTLATVDVVQPPARWLAQLASPPSSVAAIQAIRAAAQAKATDATPRLAQLAADEAQPAAIRSEAVKALADLRDAPAVLALARGRMSAGDVRLATIEAAAAIAKDDSVTPALRQPLIDAITRAAAGDPLPRTRAAALRAIGELKLDGALELLKRASDTPSQHDRVRRGAVGGLVALDRPEGLAVVARLAMPGASTRTREDAIAGLAKLAQHDRAAARGVLTTLLNDRVRQVWKAAGEALADMGDTPSRLRLEALASAKPDPIDRRVIAKWLERLGASKADEAAVPDGLQWVPLALPDSFADNTSQRKALNEDPAKFFSRRNIVGEARGGRPQILTKSTGTLGGAASPLAIQDVTILEDPTSQRVRALVVTLAESSAQSLRTYTTARVGGKLAILVDGELLGCPTLAAPISNIIQITGDFAPGDARRLRDRVLTAGALELREAVRLGERGDEADLRAKVRGQPENP